jgi:hypothetical protein
MANLVVHFEIHAAEPQRLIDFYSALLGWTFTKFGETDYWVINTGDGSIVMGSPGQGINGGLVQRQGPSPKVGDPVAGANLVLGVDDVDDVFTRGIELGGVGALPPADMPGVGRLAYLIDPDGNIFGFISPVLSDGTNVMGASAADPGQ